MTDTNNLKKVQSRRFMARFDLPVQDIAHYTEDQLRQLFFDACCPVNKDGARRWKVWGQLEKGTNGGRWHYQLYYEAFDGASGTPIRADTIVKAIRSVTDVDGKTVSVYIKKASKTSERCVAYVTKEKTRVFGPWSNVPETEWPTRDEHPSGKACRDDLFQAIMSDGLTMHDVLDTPELSVVASSCMQWAERMEKEYQRVQWGDGSPRRSMEVIYLYGDTYSG